MTQPSAAQRFSDGTASPATVVLVDPDTASRRQALLALRAEGLGVRAFARPAWLLAEARPCDDSVLLADLGADIDRSIELLYALREQGWGGRALLVSDSPDAALEALALRHGFAGVLQKPLQAQRLVEAMRRSGPASDCR